MKIRSKKAVNIAIPLFIKFVIEADKLGYTYHNDFFSSLSKYDADGEDKEIIALYDSFMARLKTEFEAAGIWSWLYLGENGIKFADLRQALTSFFAPSNKSLSIIFNGERWDVEVRESTAVFASETFPKLQEIADETDTPYESFYMEMLKDYDPEVVSHNMIRVKSFMEVKKAINKTALFFYLAEELSRQGPFLNNMHSSINLHRMIIFIEQYRSLDKIEF